MACQATFATTVNDHEDGTNVVLKGNEGFPIFSPPLLLYVWSGLGGLVWEKTVSEPKKSDAIHCIVQDTIGQIEPSTKLAPTLAAKGLLALNLSLTTCDSRVSDP
jgi:hypothetical protein